MDRSKRFTHPGRPVHSGTNSASPGSILARQQLRAKTKSLTCPPLSIARYSFIQLSQLGPQWRERKCPIFETVAKGDSNPGSLDCESSILPLSYRAPQKVACVLAIFNVLTQVSLDQSTQSFIVIFICTCIIMCTIDLNKIIYLSLYLSFSYYQWQWQWCFTKNIKTCYNEKSCNF